MSEIIKKFYERHNAPDFLVKQKFEKLDKHQDIADEFESWIKNGEYKSTGAITVEGFTAKRLADSSGYYDGEGAFMMLIELRERPKKAIKQIKEGIKIK